MPKLNPNRAWNLPAELAFGLWIRVPMKKDVAAAVVVAMAGSTNLRVCFGDAMEVYIMKQLIKIGQGGGRFVP